MFSHYVDSTLVEGERIIADAHYHWFFWAKRIAACAVMMLICLIVDYAGNWPNIACVVGAAICLIDLACAYIVYTNDEMVITTHRVVLKTGFFSRDIFEMQIQKVETVLVDQSFMGRFFNYGTIACRGTGGTISKRIEIASPLNFRAAFQNAVKESQTTAIHSEIVSVMGKSAPSPDAKLDEIIRLLNEINNKLH